jgi:hypothetical protein
MAESSGIWQGLPFGFGYGFFNQIIMESDSVEALDCINEGI